MSTRDRLAQSRAQRTQGVELSNFSQPPVSSPIAPTNGTNDLSDLPAFLDEDASIQQGLQQVKDNVAQIGALRVQSLSSINDTEGAELARIDDLTDETRSLLQELKARIQGLEAARAKGDVQLRKNRITLLRSKFVQVVQDYQAEEQANAARAKNRVERQLRIVKPDATPEEISRVVNGGGQQVFADALTNTTRYAESRLAYNEALARQQELLKVEQTLAELAQLFQDMATLVEQHDVVINTIEETADNIHKDSEAAHKHTVDAVISARGYRRKRWICFGIIVVVIAILALVLGLHFGLNHNNGNNSNSNNNNNNGTST